MTRETKIGLLVGLAFILVVGILLSEHVTRTTEAPQATLVQAGDTVRQAVRSPGGAAEPPITTVVPREQAQPQQPVPTQRELERPVVLTPPVTPAQNAIVIPPGTPRTETPVQSAPPSPWDALERAAAEQGVELSPVGGGNAVQVGSPVNPTASNRTPPPAPNGTREYTAEPGDNLHKIAQKVMGTSTKANRDAIVRLNPSLQANPDAIIVGQKYIVPAMPGTAINTAPPAGNAQPSNPRTPAAATSSNVVVYEVKPGDSLWKIAVEQCGSPSAIAQIRKLNEDTLRGDTVTVGMKLKLPKTDATARVDD